MTGPACAALVHALWSSFYTGLVSHSAASTSTRPHGLRLRMSLRLRAWIALLVMLTLACLPTLTHAWSAATGHGGSAWADPAGEICAPAGSGWSATSAGAPEPGSPAHAAAHLQHCAACLIAVVALAPSPRPRLGLLLADAPTQPPPGGTTACPSGRTARHPAQPRAPPTSA
ncbi:MAG: hypothetical protein RLZZ584_2036 [Pseudomonadota bacterium]|jgi:hypothetical protein